MATQLWFSELQPKLWNTVGIGGYEFNVGDTSRRLTVGADLIGWSNSVRGLLSTVGTAANSTATTSSVTGPTAGKIVDPAGNTTTGAFRMWLTDPLAADVTISGTISFAFCGAENNMSANAAIGCAVYRLDGLGAFTQIIFSLSTVELNTVLAKVSWTGTPTSTACKKGDRLLIVPYYDDAPATTMAAAFTMTFVFNGTLAAIGDSNITFNENLSFISTDPTGTAYYLRDTASDLAGSGQKALNTAQGSGTVTAVYATANGPLTHPGNQLTATGGGIALEWFTPPLNSFTLGSAVKCEIGAASILCSVASGGGGLYFSVLEIAICDTNGTGAVVWARSYMSIADTLAVPGVLPIYVLGQDTVVAAGKRLRFRIYFDDNLLGTVASNQTSGTNVTLRYDGTSTYGTKLTFTQTFTEQVSSIPSTVVGSLRVRRRMEPLIVR